MLSASLLGGLFGVNKLFRFPETEIRHQIAKAQIQAAQRAMPGQLIYLSSLVVTCSHCQRTGDRNSSCEGCGAPR